MGTLNILRRYLERNSSGLPADNNKLRQHVVAVASEAKLPLSEKELEELVPATPEKKPKTGQPKEASEKSGNDTSKEI